MAATIRLFSRAMVSGSQSAAGAGGVRTCYSATRPNMVLTKECINVDIPEREGTMGCFYYTSPQSFIITFSHLLD